MPGKASAEMKVALALSGGSARGWAHIGVLRVLAEAGVGIGAVAGTSIGALAALAYAAGKLDALEATARGATFGRVLSYLDPHAGRGAWLGGRRIARELSTHFAGLRLEALPIPVALVAADLATGEEIRLRDGPAIAAVQASIALPGVFRSVRRDGRVLIDGGMVANLPLGAARALAPALPLVGVDLITDYRGPTGSPAAPSILRAAFLMTVRSQTRLAVALDPPDLLVTIPAGHIGLGAYTRAEELIALGREAASAALPAIRALAA